MSCTLSYKCSDMNGINFLFGRFLCMVTILVRRPSLCHQHLGKGQHLTTEPSLLLKQCPVKFNPGMGITGIPWYSCSNGDQCCGIPAGIGFKYHGGNNTGMEIGLQYHRGNGTTSAKTYRLDLISWRDLLSEMPRSMSSVVNDRLECPWLRSLVTDRDSTFWTSFDDSNFMDAGFTYTWSSCHIQSWFS